VQKACHKRNMGRLACAVYAFKGNEFARFHGSW
jgi:hypothetical protein